jgi:SOS-response transcriptional repressor LexA
MDLGKRVKALRKAKGWSQEELASRTSMSRGRIGQLETNPLAEVKGANLVSLASALGFSTEKLLSKEELLLIAGVKTKPLTRKIPILSWASLSSINKGEKLVEESDRWLGCPSDIGENSFALEVENDLMTSNSGRSYPVGSFVFVDQDKPVRSGDRVIAVNRKTLDSVFREYVIEGSVSYLKPLNTQYSTKECDEHTEIIGVIVGSYLAE